MRFPLNRLIESRFWIFLLIGSANTLISYAVFGVSYKVIDLNYTLSLSVAYLLGIFVSYSSHRRVTFKSKLGHREAFSRFLIIYLLIFVLNTVLLTALTESLAMDPLLGQAICILLLTVLGFISQSMWVFKL